MAQKAVFVEVDGILYPEVFTYMPDSEDISGMIEDMKEDGYSFDSEAVANITWLDIGEGESDTDEFFPEKDLLKWFEDGTLEKEAERAGHNVEVVEQRVTHLYGIED